MLASLAERPVAARALAALLFASAAVLALLALVGLFVLFQTATSSLDLADADLRVGFPLAAAGAVTALGWCWAAAARALFWWRPKPPPERDYFPL